ncbi:hypothetical protein MLOOGBEN_06740 [Bacillus sp. EB106-08-02-XG196]|nr:hypothetical protein [Bacillus sp. EB106-08-02-XG196]
MKFKIFYKANYLGEYQDEVLYTNNDVIGPGSVLTLANSRFSVRNIMVRKNGEIVLEVSK